MFIPSQTSYYIPGNNGTLKRPSPKGPEPEKTSTPADNTSADITPSKISPVYLIPRKSVTAKKSYIFETGNNNILLQIPAKSGLGDKPALCHAFDDNKEKSFDNILAEAYGIDKNYQAKWADYIVNMDKAGENYELPFIYAKDAKKLYYAIYYEDTKKWDDNNGKGYELNTEKLKHKAVIFDKKEHNQPLIQVIKPGKTIGKIVVLKNFHDLQEFLTKNKENKEPLICIIDSFDDYKGTKYINQNVRGVIINDGLQGRLNHAASIIRNRTDASAQVFDKNVIEDLKKREGEYVEIKINSEKIDVKETDKAEVLKQIQETPVIPIPEQKTTYKLLQSRDYKPDIVGPKAVNLRKLEEMKQKGKLKDVLIPKSFAIPCGVIDKVFEANPSQADIINKKIEEAKKETDHKKIIDCLNDAQKAHEGLEFPDVIKKEIINFKNKCGLGDNVMVRSAFNGEDVKGYSAAGLYDSFLAEMKSPFNTCSKPDESKLFINIKNVCASKWNPGAYWSRNEHHIKHDKIKPTVLVQDHIDADYTFTLYTNDPEKENDGILIEMDSKKSKDPYVIRYDRKKDEINIECIARNGRRITLDENFNIIHAEPINDPLKNNEKEWENTLKKVCKAALEVEQEFDGEPQDIEGGIKFEDGKPQIYFWQTRDQ